MSWLTSVLTDFTSAIVTPNMFENVAYAAIYGLPLATQLSLLHHFVKVTMFTANQTMSLVQKLRSKPREVELIILEVPQHVCKLSVIPEEEDENEDTCELHEEDYCIITTMLTCNK